MARSSKRDDILAAASKLFLEQGFQPVSMDQIAAAVPVSKPTLYAHFKDKRDLFVAVIEARCVTAMDALRTGIEEHADAEKGLTRFGQQFLALLYSRESLQFHRVMTQECENFPEMARLFYDTGPAKILVLLRDYLANLDRQGVLAVPDPARAADIFIAMLKGRLHFRALLGISGPEDVREREALLAEAVRIFIHGLKR